LRVLREWRGKTQLYISHKTSIGRVIFPTWKADEERERPRLRRKSWTSSRFCLISSHRARWRPTLGGFRRRTPGPPPFSSMNSTPGRSTVRYECATGV
jgi:hypothetical protein